MTEIRRSSFQKKLQTFKKHHSSLQRVFDTLDFLLLDGKLVMLQCSCDVAEKLQKAVILVLFPINVSY